MSYNFKYGLIVLYVISTLSFISWQTISEICEPFLILPQSETVLCLEQK